MEAEACGEQVVDRDHSAPYGVLQAPGRSPASRRRMVVRLTPHAVAASRWVSIGRELMRPILPARRPDRPTHLIGSVRPSSGPQGPTGSPGLPLGLHAPQRLAQGISRVLLQGLFRQGYRRLPIMLRPRIATQPDKPTRPWCPTGLCPEFRDNA